MRGVSRVLCAAESEVADPFGPRTENYALQAMFLCPETRQRMQVNLTASACKPHAEVSLRKCKFGECPANEVRDVLVTVKNVGTTLAFNYSINKVCVVVRTTPLL
jgi:hypothetical protein